MPLKKERQHLHAALLYLLLIVLPVLSRAGIVILVAEEKSYYKFMGVS